MKHGTSSMLANAFLIIVFVLVIHPAFSQTGYRITCNVKGWKDTVVYLGHYYGETVHLSDTANVDKKGSFVFEGQKPLQYRGVYFVAMMKDGKANKQFELLIADKQNFTITTRSIDCIKFMKVSGDHDNQLFYENMNFQFARRKEAAPFEKRLGDSTLTEKDKIKAEAAYRKISDQVYAYQNNIVDKYPNTLTAKIIRAYQPVKIPDAPRRSDGTIDSTFRLKWYRQHFFDNFDLAEPGLICMPEPLYKQKINEYLDKLFAPNPDTLTKALTRYMDIAKQNKETYKYAAWTTLLKYQQPEIMGLDEVYVNVYDKYYGSGEMNFWISEKTNKSLKEQADRFRKSLIGNLGANLVMQDLSLKPKALYDIQNKYTILYIFDPDCGHCREETPKLVSFYNSKKWDVEVYAVSADTSMQKLRDYVKEMSMKWITVDGLRSYTRHYQDLYDAILTPSLYVLDRQKKIIAKKIPVERLDEFFTNYEKLENARKGK